MANKAIGLIIGALAAVGLGLALSRKVQAVPTYALSIVLWGQGSVRLTPDRAEYPEGAQVQVLAISADGWQFDHFEMGDQTTVANPIQVNMDADKTVTAVFAESAGGWTPIDITWS